MTDNKETCEFQTNSVMEYLPILYKEYNFQTILFLFIPLHFLSIPFLLILNNLTSHFDSIGVKIERLFFVTFPNYTHRPF